MTNSVLGDEGKEFAYAFLPDRESYHSHKENMAYAVFLVEAGFFSALFTTDLYTNLLQNLSNPKPIAVGLVLFIWTLLHVFMRWQLRNRRIAAIQVSTIFTALLDNMNNNSDVEPQNEIKCAGKIKKFLDYFFPISSATVQSDVDLKAYPEWYRVRILLAQSNGARASFGEVFPTTGSFIMLIVALTYVVNKQG